MTGAVPQTIPALIADGAVRFGDRLAVVDGDVRLTYVDLAGGARRAAAAYLASGVRQGDRVALWAPNRYEFVLALLGAQLIGAAVVPLNTRYRGFEARDVIARSGARALVLCNGFLDTDYLRMLQEAAGGRSRGWRPSSISVRAARAPSRGANSSAAQMQSPHRCSARPSPPSPPTRCAMCCTHRAPRAVPRG
ncbi:AMP-binding protein [Tsukamurella soli]|uniref:AMP-binding protein n=1 Tax=Tsukamurella soli TaxID=644556 RepID=UPI003616045F